MTFQKYLIFIFTIVVAVAERYFWVLYNEPSDDLLWYLNPFRSTQLTALGFEKGYVSMLIDKFHSYEARLLMASATSGIFFVTAIYSSNGNHGFKTKDAKYYLIVIFTMANIYFCQLDMHLWRQQIGFYAFTITVNQSRLIPKYVFFLLSVFFHEVTLALFLLYFLSNRLNKVFKWRKRWIYIISLSNLFIITRAVQMEHYQLAIISIFCWLIIISNEKYSITRRNVIFIVLLSNGVLSILFIVDYLGIGENSYERLIYLVIVAGLFIFFNTGNESAEYLYNKEDRINLLRNKLNVKNAIFKRRSTNFLNFVKFLFLIYYATFK